MRYIKKIVKICLLFYGSLVGRIAAKKKDDVVIIFLDGLGDLVLWLASARYLREWCGDQKITLLCRENCRILAEQTGLFDEVSAVPLRTDVSTAQNIKTLLKTTRRSAKRVIVPRYSLGIFDVILARMITADEKIAFRTGLNTSDIEKELNRTFTAVYDEKWAETPMELVRNQQYTNQLLGKNYPADVADLSAVSGGYQVPEEKYFLLTLGASTPNKRWPAERFAAVAEYVAQRTGWTCVLSGVKGEAYLAEQFSKLYHGKMIDLIGATSVLQAVDLIRGAELTVSGDTSTYHIAAACNTQSFVIPEGTYYPNYYPYQVSPGIHRKLPVAVYKQMSCRGCLLHGTMKPECVEHSANKQMLECVASTSAEMVIAEIDRYLTENGIA